ncbi:DDT domain-containing protein DDR4 isoform X2 [Macadamia integrifolia]|uniref:DDT domain-containing protein DDR4 isoform X2 n=1 Tax=Macadamia integrifolia TaxID=60698 RepID=UPI001C4F7BAF|nr:DDT domain-containing protein DDR4 isoform X2 [Macadamia integrifolia]
MARRHGRESPTIHVIDEEEEGISAGRSSMDSVFHPSEPQLARLHLRERWELASVLNFFKVFQPIIGSKLEFSAEEIETALITPNGTLARLHILLLKGIPPVSKKLTDPDVWVTELCKKLKVWWSTVAEGGIPLLVSHGEEISKYKEIDPTVRLVILKALCEIRLIHDDILTYINDELKDGRELSTFRKDRIDGDGNGTTYWYDGDSVIGYRLYKEVKNVEYNQSSQEKGHLAPATTGFQWETLATNLDEFREISDKLCSSEVVVESNVGKIVEKEILPILEKLQKKERTLKRQSEKALLQSGHFNSFGMMNTRTSRVRRPVNYTFDEYDRSIDEALEVIKGDPTGDKRHEQEIGSDPEGSVTDEIRLIGTGNGSSESDDDYDSKNEVDDDDIGDNLGTSEKESKKLGPGNGVKRNSQKRNGLTEVVGLRRSRRISGTSSPGLMLGSDVDMKQRPPCDTIFEPHIISDSEDLNMSEHLGNKMLCTG